MSASAARRAFLAAQWREAKVEDATVLTAHPLAPQIVEETLLTVEADAITEVTRRLALRDSRQDYFTFKCHLNVETAVIDLGDVISIGYNRYGLDEGALLRVVGIEPDPADGMLELTVWAPTISTTRNRVTQTGEYRITSTGAYRVTVAA